VRRATIRLAVTEPVPKTTSSPDGNHDGASSVGASCPAGVSRVSLPVLRSRTTRCRSPSVSTTKAARLPSGDNTGALPGTTGVPGTGDTSPV
jgi:hypothetical protein